MNKESLREFAGLPETHNAWHVQLAAEGRKASVFLRLVILPMLGLFDTTLVPEVRELKTFLGRQGKVPTLTYTILWPDTG